MGPPDRSGAAWRFALAVYDKPEVAPSCLRLQDEGGVDVVLLLAVGYAARSGLRLDDAALERLDGHVADWRRQIVRPLREVRRALKQGRLAGLAEGAPALRRTIQGAELDAERLQLAALMAEMPEVPPGAASLPALPALHALLGRVAAMERGLLPLLAVVAGAMDDTAV